MSLRLAAALGTWTEPPCLCCDRPIKATAEATAAGWAILECNAWACADCHATYTHEQLVQFGLGGLMQWELFEGSLGAELVEGGKEAYELPSWYLLWQDADRKRPLAKKVAEGAACYEDKHGERADVCLCNEASARELDQVGPVKVIGKPFIRPGMFWIGKYERRQKD